eukprot:m.149808 g.149808  ORF g.149808 m.149808 type:complete len:88 (+) comp14253_c0_seq2:182-445(+)
MPLLRPVCGRVFSVSVLLIFHVPLSLWVIGVSYRESGCWGIEGGGRVGVAVAPPVRSHSSSSVNVGGTVEVRIDIGRLFSTVACVSS